MKKLGLSTLALLGVVALSACNTQTANFKVGMVTDSGTISDKSFNQGTWEGVQKGVTELKIDSMYLKPLGESKEDYLNAIDNLVATGYGLIVTPGFKFGDAIGAAQSTYASTKFVILDAAPSNLETADDPFDTVVADNTVAIFFAEEQAGFLAGVAAAVEAKALYGCTTPVKFGFVGGIEIPPVQKFNWGWQQGLKYATDNNGACASIAAEDVVYEGTFTNVEAGATIAGQMFDRGVKVIHAAAGGVGVGVITEAKNRVQAGGNVWVVGVDVDQYATGLVGEKSVILTSAMKRIDVASYDMIIALSKNEFPGGETLVYNVTNNGVGIPDANPNLSKAATDAVAAAKAKIVAGTLTVSAVKGDLIA